MITSANTAKILKNSQTTPALVNQEICRPSRTRKKQYTKEQMKENYIVNQPPKDTIL